MKTEIFENYMKDIPNTKMPNELFDYFLSKVSSAEFIVLNMITYTIYRGNKISAIISYKDLINKTGLSKTGVMNSIKKLEEYGIIEKSMKKNEMNHQTNTYKVFLDRKI